MPRGAPEKRTTKDLLRRLSRAGFARDFVREAVLPDWWDEECATEPSLLPEIEIRVARFLDLPLSVVRDPSRKLGPPSYPNARLRKVSNIQADRLGPAIHAALRVAAAALRNPRGELAPMNPPPGNPSAWRSLLAKANGTIDLSSVVADLWKRGIPVIQVKLLPSPRFQGLASIVEGRPVILLGHDIDAPGRLLLLATHEAGHIVHGDCVAGAPIVDEDDEVVEIDEIERAADRYASMVALGEAAPMAPKVEDHKMLATRAAETSRERASDVGALLWSWAIQSRDFARAEMALRALYKHLGGRRTLRRLFDQHVDVSAASETDLELLRCVHGDAERNACPD